MKKSISLTIIILLAVALFSYFVLLDQYNNLGLLRFEVEQRKIDLDDLKKSFEKLSNLDEELKGYQPEIEKISLALPQDPDIPSVASFIQKIAEENNLTITSLSFKGAAPASPSSLKKGAVSSFKETSFSLNVSGSYADFKNFLSALEKSIRLINVDKLSFLSGLSGGTSRPGNYFNFNLTLKVYSY